MNNSIKQIRHVTIVGMAVNLVLSALKLCGGMLGSSQALIADAVHSLSDCSTDLAIILGVKHWTKPADQDHPHGHYKLESMITIFIGGALFAVSAGLIYKAITSLHHQEKARPSMLAFTAACVSVIVKEILYRWTAREGRLLKSSAVLANAWHHRSDALSSLPVAAAVAGTIILPDLVYLDQIAAVLVSIMILKAAWKIASPCLGQLLDQGAPPKLLDTINNTALATDGVLSVHALRTRYIGSEAISLDLHVKVDPELSVRKGHDISEQVKKRLISEIDQVVDAVIHLEPHENLSD